MSYKILISDKIEEICLQIFQQAGFSVDLKPDLPPTELEALIGNYDGQVVRSATKVTRAVLEKGKSGSLKIVGRAGAGVDNIDMVAAEALGIKVVNTPGLNSNAVAELTLALAFILARNIGPGLISLKEGRWEKKGLAGSELSGKSIGLVGFGAIGRLVSKKAQALGMRVLAYDPLVSKADILAEGATPLSLEALWKEADFISLHLPKTPDTVNLVNATVLKSFKKTAFLLNCARGGLVDEEALYAALQNKELAGAALDVFAKEPPGDSPLLTLPNFVATPHLGASTSEAQLGVAQKVAVLIVDYLNNLGN
ncbi:MAG: hydroxyacid dehydrogenase [Deltaproteobacteria bacterium]|jgi:D-3-phosphoglycerate dehydrogenase|nr:hydroxyacid dehydrogenase [Deltaproteobacteria bacterium]